MSDDNILDEALNLAKSLGDKPAKVKKELAPVESIDLTDAEKRELEAQAEKEVAAELKEQARKAFKADAKQKLKRKKLFQAAKDETGEDVESMTLQLASHSPFITLDGMRYYHGATYRLTSNKRAVINEVAYRGFLHQAEIKGMDMNDFLGRQKVGGVV